MSLLSYHECIGCLGHAGLFHPVLSASTLSKLFHCYFHPLVWSCGRVLVVPPYEAGSWFWDCFAKSSMKYICPEPLDVLAARQNLGQSCDLSEPHSLVFTPETSDWGEDCTPR